jgi:hypothetical protein
MGNGSHAKKAKLASEAQDALDPADDSGPVFAPPLQPRPRLVIMLSVVLGLWVAFLLGLYFHTVYPERRTTNPRQVAPLPSETAKP